MKVTDALSRNLLAARKAAGLTQQEVADAAGLSREAISNIERGGIATRLDSVERLAVALGKSPLELLTPATGRWKK